MTIRTMWTIHTNASTFPNRPSIEARVWLEDGEWRRVLGRIKAAPHESLYEQPEEVREQFDREFEETLVTMFLQYLHQAQRTAENVAKVDAVVEILKEHGTIRNAVKMKKLWISVIV